MNATQPKRIVVLESDFLLSAGVQSFLSSHENLDVIGIDTKDPEEIYREIMHIRPEVIILDERNRLISPNDLCERLKDLPSFRTVLMNNSDNQVQVFERNQVSIQKLGDFLAVL